MTVTTTHPGCWADVLTRAERFELSEKLSRACAQLAESMPDVFAEFSLLHGDVTEREVDTEVIATFHHDGKTYEIDHLGIRRPLNWGEFAIYCDDAQVGEFAIPASARLPKFQPDDLPPIDELVALAIADLQES
jgi:hypothetical protein